jgi:hypothetical protein
MTTNFEHLLNLALLGLIGLMNPICANVETGHCLDQMVNVWSKVTSTRGGVGANDYLTPKIVTHIEPQIWRSHLKEEVPSSAKHETNQVIFISTNITIKKDKSINKASLHVLGNPKVVYRHQRARSVSTYMPKLLSENGGQVRAMLEVDPSVQLLWPHVRTMLA